MRALAVEVAARWAVRPHTASSFHDASRNASPLAAGAGGAGRTSSVMRRSSWASSSGTLLSKRSCTTCRGTDRAAEAVMGPIRSRAPPGAWAWRLLRSPAGCWISWVRRRGAARGAARGARAGRARAHLQRLCNLPPRVARPEVLPRRGSARSAARALWAQALGAGFGRRLWACGGGVEEGVRKGLGGRGRLRADGGGTWGTCTRMEESAATRSSGSSITCGGLRTNTHARECGPFCSTAPSRRAATVAARRGAARRGGLRCGAGLHLGALALARGHEGAHAALAHLDALPARRVDALGRRTRQHHIQKVGPAALAPCHSAPRHKPPQQTFLS
jgi:hypothetical protein